MAEKIEITDEMLEDISSRILAGETSYQKEADKLGMDRTTLSKKCKEFRRRKPENTKIEEDNNLQKEKLTSPDIAEENKEDKQEVEKVTFTLPKDILRALRMKAANEGKKVVDIVKDAFNKEIEPKYFNKL